MVKNKSSYRKGKTYEEIYGKEKARELRKKNKKTRITFIPDPVCWTEAPETYKTLESQRIRWQKGTIDAIRLHSRMFFNLRYGLVGLIVFPYYLLFEVLGPFLEITGYIVFILSLMLDIVPLNFAIAFFAAAFLYGVVLSTLSVCLEELSFKFLFPDIYENIQTRLAETQLEQKKYIQQIIGRLQKGLEKEKISAEKYLSK